MITNDATMNECAACGAPIPGAKIEKPATAEAKPSFGEGGGFEFGVESAQTGSTGSGLKFGSTKADPPPPPADDLFAKFMTKKAGGSWTCDVCMITNDATMNECAACGAPRPGAKIEKPATAESKPSFGEGGGFKFGVESAQTGSTSS